ncbi:MAG: thioredoxin [Sumerlaeia bacterium]
MAEGVLNLQDTTFEQEVLQSDVPVLVDFWATWCGPCLRIAPIIEELAKDNAGKVKVAKLDVDEAQDVAQSFGVSSIPTLIFFKGGEEVDRIMGAVPKSVIQQKIDSLA